ncbi:DUF2716 domain-containing protein [Streptomyces gardneri]|uniref:DUF2716 domain-containing protein n=1 Tax=Streptomyces gardneri TaxID=66892 RepID=UPI0035D738D7
MSWRSPGTRSAACTRYRSRPNGPGRSPPVRRGRHRPLLPLAPERHPRDHPPRAVPRLAPRRRSTVGPLLHRLRLQAEHHPHGDYYLHLTDDLRLGTFGHPWEETLTVWGPRCSPPSRRN